MRSFTDLDPSEVIALAISLEEEHGRIYAEYAHGLAETSPAAAAVFAAMAEDENQHRCWLIDLYREKFGDHIPLVRPQDVRGFIRHEPIWATLPLDPEQARAQSAIIEYEARQFYASARDRATDAQIRKLLGDLVAAEDRHLHRARSASEEKGGSESGDSAHRAFVLQYVQPGLNGLLDLDIGADLRRRLCDL